MSKPTQGQIAYEAFEREWRNEPKLEAEPPWPLWRDLGEKTETIQQSCWEAAARAVQPVELVKKLAVTLMQHTVCECSKVGGKCLPCEHVSEAIAYLEEHSR